MTRTYVDSDVLIAAAKGSEALSEHAMRTLEDEGREYIGSTLLRMETSAPAAFHGYPLQAQFYEEYFGAVVGWVPVTDALVQIALDECLNSGLQAFDALHVAAAAVGGADEFITAEKRSSRILNARGVKVISIRP